eukprot:NODE_1097_length_1070_cov_542.136141_g761_i0.p1 GENE.NODE_1097_length_1070_cov_542.136141_g761_i0~~NODE_1097_length_1070_cov_542.136141_g761_i0.p1  ORF type:complete len:219 (+),score=43.29 NODE_1097_length_1070_cov_542.136141_g761_i0:129-785(+)
MRRKPGVAGIRQQQDVKQTMRSKGEEITDLSTQVLQQQMAQFQQQLADFAVKHKHQINKNAEFRHQFNQMCAKLGVDPLASKKGFWSDMLGYGDFYYQLAVQAIEVCLSNKRQNGGLMPLAEVTAALTKRRAKTAGASEISEGDVEEAIKKVAILGDGFKVVTLGLSGIRMVQSVPMELTDDTTALLGLAQSKVSTNGREWGSSRQDTKSPASTPGAP